MTSNKGPAVVATAALFSTITTLMVAARIFTKARILKVFVWADYLLILTQIFFTITCALEFVGVHHGMGKHMTEISVADLTQGPYYEFLIELFYVITATLLRLSIGLQLWAIVGDRRIQEVGAQRLTILVVIGIIFTYSIVFFMALLFQCEPLTFFWEQFSGELNGACSPAATSAALAYVHALLSAAADVALGLLPCWILQWIVLEPRRKIQVICLLGLGVLAGAVALIRIPYIHTLIYSVDFFWDCVPILITSTIEPAIGIIAACAATYRPLYKWIVEGNGRPLPGRAPDPFAKHRRFVTVNGQRVIPTNAMSNKQWRKHTVTKGWDPRRDPNDARYEPTLWERITRAKRPGHG